MFSHDIVLEIAKYLCVPDRNRSLALVCQSWAIVILRYRTYIGDCHLTNHGHPGGMQDALIAGHAHCMRMLYDHNDLECWLIPDTNCPALQRSASEYAASHGYLDCLQFLLEHNGKQWDADAEAICAVEQGHLHCLRYLCENGYPPQTESVIATAVASQHFECVQYLHQVANASWIKFPNVQLSFYGNLRMLEYAHSNGYNITMIELYDAIESDSAQCLQYLHQHNCPWDEHAYCHAIACGSLACVEYLNKLK